MNAHLIALPQLLADDFARNGYRTVAPNLFQEPAPESAFEPGSTFNIMEWFKGNGPEYSEPRVRKVLAALKEAGVTKIGLVGYCYGARSGFNLAFENEITALAVAHPSLLNIPDDVEVRVLAAGVPEPVIDRTLDSL